jgi:poly-beta-1,6-N-acetyl-D-glucosamine synthase
LFILFGIDIFQLLFWFFAAATAAQFLLWWGIYAPWAINMAEVSHVSKTSETHPKPPRPTLLARPSALSTLPSARRKAQKTASKSRSAALRTPMPAQHTLPQPRAPFSILVCARNEARNLERHLPALFAQEYAGDFEIVVADDASTDDTPAVLAGFQALEPRLRVVRIEDKKMPGKKAALTRAVAEARYEHLLLTDADCCPVGPHWLSGMAACFEADENIEIVLGYGPLSPAAGLLNAWSRYETAYTALQYFAFAQTGMPFMGVGRNIAWKKSLFDQTGGFETHANHVSGDDDLFVNAAGRHRNTACCTDPDTFVYSDAKPEWNAWLRQKRRHLSVGALYRPGPRILIGGAALSHCTHYGLGAILLLCGQYALPCLLLYTLRLASVLFVYSRAFSRLEQQALLPRLPFFDGLLAVYYGTFVPMELFWKKGKIDW